MAKDIQTKYLEAYRNMLINARKATVGSISERTIYAGCAYEHGRKLSSLGVQLIDCDIERAVIETTTIASCKVGTGFLSRLRARAGVTAAKDAIRLTNEQRKTKKAALEETEVDINKTIYTALFDKKAKTVLPPTKIKLEVLTLFYVEPTAVEYPNLVEHITIDGKKPYAKKK